MIYKLLDRLNSITEVISFSTLSDGGGVADRVGVADCVIDNNVSKDITKNMRCEE